MTLYQTLADDIAARQAFNIGGDLACLDQRQR